MSEPFQEYPSRGKRGPLWLAVVALLVICGYIAYDTWTHTDPIVITPRSAADNVAPPEHYRPAPAPTTPPEDTPIKPKLKDNPEPRVMDKYLAADMKAMGITTKKQKKLFAVVYGCAQYFFEDAFNAAGDLYDANREKGDVKFGTAVGNYCPDVVNAYEVLTPHESTPPPTAPPAYPDMDDTPMVGDQDPDQAPMF